MGLLGRQALFLVFVVMALVDTTSTADMVMRHGWASAHAAAMVVALALDAAVLCRLWGVTDTDKPAPAYLTP